MNNFAASARQLRRQLADDPHRPRYHFLPPANWMNDPNGIIQWKGITHLFYQHNPQQAVWDDMHWGHAASADLVHWADMPIALAPTPGGPDEDGCWSGCAIDNGGFPTILYTGVQGDYNLPRSQRVCLATSDDDLLRWRKHPGNPVLAQPPDHLDVTGFRDPFVWREDDAWFMIIGAGIEDVGGAVLLYQSDDLHQWEFLHPLCDSDKLESAALWTGAVWEVPQFFPLGDKHIMTITAWDKEQLYSAYFVGSYHDRRFYPDAVYKLDYGDRHFCAPHSLRDTAGRRILWGWIDESRPIEAQMAARWAGVMSLPRILTLAADGKLTMRPAPELEALRAARRRYANISLSGAAGGFTLDAPGAAFEIQAEFDCANAEACGIKVRCSPDEEETTIFYDAGRKQLGIDRRRSANVRDGSALDIQQGDFALSPGEALRLRVFVDCSVIEVFANERACVTSRVYPSRSDSSGIRLFSQGQTMVNSLDIWTMSSIWEAP